MDVSREFHQDLRSGGILRWIGAPLARIRLGWAFIHRSDLRTLAMMSDRELRDIGLLRQDIRDADLYRAGALDFLRDRREEQRGRLKRIVDATAWRCTPL